jgi:hypothetical protein
MSKTSKPDKLARASRYKSLCAWAVIGLGCLPFITGCTTTHPQTHSGDPLFGEYYPKGPNGQPMPPPPPPNKTTSLGVPPYPSANSASSTASLAANTNLPGGRNLAIDQTSGTNWTLTNTNNTANPAVASWPVVQPVPRDTSVPGPVASNGPPPPPAKVAPITIGNTSNPIIATGSWSNGTQAPASRNPPPMGVVTPEGLEATLKGKGAIGLKQETVPEGVRVSCYVPQRTNPANLQYLETVARDYQSALQAILQQVDQ